MVRSFHPNDIEKAHEIYDRYYKDDFDFPDFMRGYLCAVTVEDEEGIVIIGGVRPIAEAVILTNKDRSPQARVKVMPEMLEVLSFITARTGYDQIHAFIQDPRWSKRLQKSFGFRPTTGQSVVLSV